MIGRHAGRRIEDAQRIAERIRLHVGGASFRVHVPLLRAEHALHDKLVEQIHACTMPADSRLPDDQRATLLEWLACGDPNN